MDDFTEKHLKNWIDKTVHRNERDKVESSIREVLKDHPDLLEKNYSWPEMRMLTER